MEDDKLTAAPPGAESPDFESAAAPAANPPAGPPPSQFASSLWGTNDWEESEWKPATSGLSAAINEPARPATLESGKANPPRLTAEQYATSTQVIGGYEVINPLGDESEGLYLARHTKLARVVSLKALTLPDVEDPKQLLAFVTRARAATRLQDPHLVQLHDFVEQGDKWFAVTEPVFGESLRSRAAHAPFSIAAAVAVIEQAARALAVLRHAHRSHGALTMRSLFLVEREQKVDHLELLDFGAGSQQDALVGFSALAPERKNGAEADARSDVWGLGSVLFELLEGKPPSEASGLSPVSRTGEPIPAPLAELVTRCLLPEPRERFPNVESMAAALPHALGLASRPLPSRTSHPALQSVASVASAPAAAAPAARPRRGKWAALVLVPLAAGGWWLWQQGPLEGLLAAEAPRVELPAVAEPPPLVVAPLARPAPVETPELHPMLLQVAGKKLLAGAALGAPSKVKLKPARKKTKKKGPARGRR